MPYGMAKGTCCPKELITFVIDFCDCDRSVGALKQKTKNKK